MSQTPHSPADPAIWYYMAGPQQVGPLPTSAVFSMIQGGGLAPSTMVWREGMTGWAPAASLPEFAYAFSAGAAYAGANPLPPEVQAFASKKIAAGICGILLGGLGVHKFILGLNNAGTIMLVVWLVGLISGMCLVVPLLASIAINTIGLVEGIIYLTKSDADFYQTYAVQRKEWF